MIVEVFADAGKVGDDVDSVRAQVLRRPDAGEQEELRRPDRPAARDDLRGARLLDSALLGPLHAHTAGTVEQQAPGGRAGDEPEVGVGLDRADVRGGGAVADPVLDAVLHERDAVLRRAVVVGVRGDAALVRRLRDRHVDRVGLEGRDEAHRARSAGLAPLDPLVDRQDVVPRPALRAEGRPRIEVLGRAAHPDHRVQAARSSEHLAARPRKAPAGRMRLRHRLVRPVDLGQPELVEPAGVVNGGVVVPAAGLEQENAGTAVHEPPRHDRTGRSGADDDDVGGALAHDRARHPSSMGGHYASLG